MPLLYGIHTPLPKTTIDAKQPQQTRVIATLRWHTRERRGIIKQAMTFYKILNNIINIIPPPGLLKPSTNRGHYIATRCRINTAVFSFYPREIRIWNMIPPHITEIENPIASQAAIMKPPLHNTQSPKLPVKQTNKQTSYNKQTNIYTTKRMRTRSTTNSCVSPRLGCLE